MNIVLLIFFHGLVLGVSGVKEQSNKLVLESSDVDEQITRMNQKSVRDKNGNLLDPKRYTFKTWDAIKAHVPPNTITSFKDTHHVMPANLIVKCVNEINKDVKSKAKYSTLLQNYINKPPFKDFIKARLNEDAGIFLNAVVKYSPFNLVRGPKNNERSDDPEDKYEDIMLTCQRADFQRKMKQIKIYVDGGKYLEAMELFFNLPQALPVEWIKDSQTNKYKVKSCNFTVLNLLRFFYNAAHNIGSQLGSQFGIVG